MQLKILTPLLACILACSPKSESSSRSDSASTSGQPAAQASVSVSAASSSCDSHIVGTYSDLKTSSATGDFGGIQIDIQCSNGVYRASVIVAEGAPADPGPSYSGSA